MFISSVLDATAIDEKQVQSFFSTLTLQKLLYAALLLVLCVVLIRLILKAADKLFSHSKLDHTIFGFLRTTAKAVLIFIAVMLVAGTLGVDTSSLLAILSVAGLAVSLSMQTALSNVAGALMILTAKPFRAGFLPCRGKYSMSLSPLFVKRSEVTKNFEKLPFPPIFRKSGAKTVFPQRTKCGSLATFARSRPDMHTEGKSRYRAEGFRAPPSRHGKRSAPKGT